MVCGIDLAGTILAAGAAWAVMRTAAAAGLSTTAKLPDLLVGALAFAAAALVYLGYGRLLRLPELTGSLALLRSATSRLRAAV